jgi:hypothetical protein
LAATAFAHELLAGAACFGIVAVLVVMVFRGL